MPKNTFGGRDKGNTKENGQYPGIMVMRKRIPFDEKLHLRSTFRILHFNQSMTNYALDVSRKNFFIRLFTVSSTNWTSPVFLNQIQWGVKAEHMIRTHASCLAVNEKVTSNSSLKFSERRKEPRFLRLIQN
jgi:hypothetical protein